MEEEGTASFILLSIGRPYKLTKIQKKKKKKRHVLVYIQLNKRQLGCSILLFFKAETMVYSSMVVQIVNPNDQFMNLEILMENDEITGGGVFGSGRCFKRSHLK